MATSVEELYQQILGREADPGGLEYWKREIGGDGITAAERQRFIESAQPELSTRPANVDVGNVYQQVLGRDPDEEGRRFWSSYFGTEISPAEQAAFEAAAQAELQARQQAGGTTGTQGTTQGGGKPALSQYTSVDQLYQDYLNRSAAEDTEGANFWRNYFGNDIDVNELAAFQAEAAKELSTRAPTVVDQWYTSALNRPADESGKRYWLNKINEVGLTQARNMFYNQAVQELLGRTAVNVPTTPGGTSVNVPGSNVIGSSLPGGSSYQPQTINVGGAGAVTSGGFTAYPYGQTAAAATLGKPAFDVTQYMAQNPMVPQVAAPVFGPPGTIVPSAGGLFGPIKPPGGG